MDIANSFVYVENTALSVLINNKISKAKSMGIEIESIISFANFTMPYITICSLIGNILDNAIEATEKTEDKYIQLIVKGKDGECKISCENTFLEQPVFNDGKYQTSKKDKKNHGIGLSNIRDIVNEYHGTMDIHVEDTFLLSLSLKA
jgi:sensor histidine kinase regulating citrate/malate metabolism